ncbi:MAG TPA: CIA30 family protein, partial [Gemmatimonadales bacterium]|nr:CIA30 family protein [Gemmatimonadales bacterium]
MILTDFSLPDPPVWRCFTDRVMGGRSDATATVTEVQGRRALLLSGHVSLENRGGFVQAALQLGEGRARFDATRFRAIRLTVCGEAPATLIHLRSADTIFPWSHYAAPFELPRTWGEVEVPFEAFEPSGMVRGLDRSGLTRIGVVAGKMVGR